MRLFPYEFVVGEGCYRLFKQDSGDTPDPPILIEGDAGSTFHVVHSDPEYLAYLAGLLALQAWTIGIQESGGPIRQRKPILVITTRPGSFAESYLRLRIPVGELKRISIRRRVRLFQATGNVPRASDKAEYWDHFLDPAEDRTRLHNFFPSAFLAGAHSHPRLVEGRENLGRGDPGGPAVLIVRRLDDQMLNALQKSFQPILTLVEAAVRVEPKPRGESVAVVVHESIFDPELDHFSTGQIQVICFPDKHFERFCAETNLEVIEPVESANFKKALDDSDSTLRALIERIEQGRRQILVDIYRTALRLRNLLLSLPVGIQSYEQALVLSELHPSLRYQWSVSELLQSLRHRQPEISALGDWEELILTELVGAFAQLEQLLRADSPKREPLLSAIQKGAQLGRQVTLMVDSPSFATCVSQVVRMPQPLGFGLPREQVNVVAASELHPGRLEQDFIIHRILEPHLFLPSLARVKPCRIAVILYNNELRFAGEQLLRTRRLFPHHPANTTILSPIYQLVESHEAIPVFSRQGGPTLLSDTDYERYMRLFDQGGRSFDRGTVLLEEPEHEAAAVSAQVPARLVALEDETAVFLQAGSRVSVIHEDDTLASVDLEHLVRGDRLIIISPTARESIAHRILAVRRGDDMEQSAGQVISRWQTELQKGIETMQVSYAVLLRKIQNLGSQRVTPMTIAQWTRGDVLGPLDGEDIRRLGQAIGSLWLVQNWQRVGLALVMVRSGHRLLGRQITRLIQRAAVGEYELVKEDDAFLKQIGITMHELQDAVTLLQVEGVSEEPRLLPAEQTGVVLGMNATL